MREDGLTVTDDGHDAEDVATILGSSQAPWVEPEELKILVVEDDKDDAYFISRTITEVGGFDIEAVFASNVEDALKIAEFETFDAALIDFLVGGECGPDLIPRLRNRVPKCAMLLLTGQLTPSVHHHALNSGAVASLSKDELTAWRLEVALRHALHATHTMNELEGRRLSLGTERERNAAVAVLSSVLPKYVAATLDQLVDYTSKLEALLCENRHQAAACEARSARYLADDISTYCRDLVEYVEGRNDAELNGQFFDLQSVVLDVSRLVEAGCQRRDIQFSISFEEEPLIVSASENVLRHSLVLLVGSLVDILPDGCTLNASFGSNSRQQILTLNCKDEGGSGCSVRLANSDQQMLNSLRVLLAPSGFDMRFAGTDCDTCEVAQIRINKASGVARCGQVPRHFAFGDKCPESEDLQACPPAQPSHSSTVANIAVPTDA